MKKLTWLLSASFLACAMTLTFKIPVQAQAREGNCKSHCVSCGFPLFMFPDEDPHDSFHDPSDICDFMSLNGCGPELCLGPAPEDLDVAFEAAEAGDTHLLGQLALSNDRFVLNSERRSLQLISSCDASQVVANIPLSPDAFGALERMIQQDRRE